MSVFYDRHGFQAHIAALEAQLKQSQAATSAGLLQQYHAASIGTALQLQ